MELELHKAARVGDEARLSHWLRHKAWRGTKLDNPNEDGSTPLMLAASAGHTGFVQKLLGAGAKVDLVDSRGDTALLLASALGHDGVVEKLIAKGALVDHVNKAKVNALMLAANGGHVQVVRRLVTIGVDVNFAQTRTLDTALTFASYNGHSDVVAALVAAGTNVNLPNSLGNTPLILASRKGHPAVVKLLVHAGAFVDVTNNAGATALTHAIQYGYDEVVCALLTERTKITMTSKQAQDALASAELNEASMMALFTAAVRGNFAQLLAAIDTQMAFPHNDPLLHRAIKFGRMDMVELLLKRGASPSGLDASGSTPLHYAVRGTRLVGVELLLAHGADINAQDEQGDTALILASAIGRVNAVQCLLGAGANLDIANFKGQTALISAIQHLHEDVVQILLGAGAGLAMANAELDAALTAAESDSRGMAEILREYKGSAKVLFAAITRGDIDALTLAVDTHKNARTEHNRTPLHLATHFSRDDMVDILLVGGANTNDSDDSGWTAIHYAAETGNVAIISKLMSFGASIDAQDNLGQTALLLASKNGDASIVQVLLQFGAHADVASISGQTPLSITESDDVRSVLTMYHNRELYQERCFQLMSATESTPTDTELQDLVPLITSVYDMRNLMSLISLTYTSDPNMESSERMSLVKAALSHIVSEKLVFDDNACVFFKLVLDHCKKYSWLTPGDIHLFDRQAEKINTESAAWVIELQKQVQEHSWRLDAHEQSLQRVAHGITQVHKMVQENRTAIKAAHTRVGRLQSQVDVAKKLLGQLVHHGNQLSDDVQQLQGRLKATENNVMEVAKSLQTFRGAYIERLDQEQKTKTIKCIGGLLASLAGFLFAPVLKEVFGGVVDLIDSRKIANLACTSTDLVKILTNGVNDNLLKPIVENQLEKLMIPKDQFETLLREEIALQHPELLDECAKRGLTAEDLGASGMTESVKKVEAALMTEASAVAALMAELERAIEQAKLKRARMEDKMHLQHVFRSRDSDSHAPSTELAVERQADDSEPSVRDEISEEAPCEIFPRESVATPLVNPSTDHATADRIVFVDDADDFPFHAAILESRGVLEEFEDFIKVAGDGADPSAVMAMELRSVSTSHESLTAAEYAYSLGYSDVGDFLSARMLTGKDLTTLVTTPALAVELLEDEEDFAYVVIVNECAGDVNECEDMCETIGKDTYAIDARIRAKVVRETSVSERWSALQYAIHLGYVKIVQYLLKEHSPSVSMKTRIQLLKQAKERAKAVACEPTVAA